MKIYHSFWEHGWNNLNEDLYNLHKLSVLTALKSYGNITLITTEKGKEFLGDLPYTNIELFEEEIPIYLKDVWSISKLYAYQQITKKEEPFFHIDYDVFLFKKLPDWFESGDVCVQHIENYEQIEKYYYTDVFFKKCPNKYLVKEEIQQAYNMGIFGGNNIITISNYVKESFKLLYDTDNLKEYWLKDLNISHCSKAVILEQWYLIYTLRYDKVKVTTLLDENNDINEQANKLGYCHVWGAKSDEVIKEKIKKKIKNYIL